MKEFSLQEEFAISVQQFFDLFFLTPKFKLDFHVARGDSDISVGDWKELGNSKYERAIKFCSQLSDQAFLKKLTGGMTPAVSEKQDYEFIGKDLHVSSLATSSAGGFNTTTTTNYVISPKGDSISNGRYNTPGRCYVDVVVKSECKTRIFKGQVENMMNQAATQTFEQWISLVKSKIEDFKQEQLQQQQQRLRAKQQPSTISQTTLPLPMPDYLMDALSSSPSTTENSECDTDDESYFDAHDHLISPPLSRTTTPTPPIDRSATPTSLHHHTSFPMNLAAAGGMGGAGGIATLVHSMHKELQQVKSMTEVNTSRLLGLEASKASASSQPSSSSTSAITNRNEGLLPYLQRLDLLVQQQEEETQRSREKELEWRRRLEEMETKLETTSGKGRMVPGGWWGVVVFLLVWPVMAQKLWKYAKLLQPAVEKAFLKLLRR